MIDTSCKRKLEMSYRIETEREDDGRWIAEVVDLPGVMVYGDTEGEAVSKATSLALRVVADRVESSKSAEPIYLSFAASS